MKYEYYPIIGIQDGLGPKDQVPIRREINQWTESEDAIDQMQVILFLLALRRFQAISPDSRDSYFQIAGIHGMPYTSWDEPSLTESEVHRKGYCVHASSLFPLWHRPYLLLYEQRIFEIMMDEVIPDMRLDQKGVDRFQEAARKWRLPFWDWAKYPKMPYLLCKRSITIPFLKKTIDNPLYQFKMPNGKKMGTYGVGSLKSPDFEDLLEYGDCIATSRWPGEKGRASKSKSWREGVVNNDMVNEQLTGHESITEFDYGNTAEMVYRLLTYPLDFISFATTARDATEISASKSKVTNDMNIEFIHNNIHYWVGGDGGHMSQIPVATFDPVFWLHHCNLDRLFAIWQTLYPDKWFNADKTRPFDQKIIGMGDIVTSKTPFRPFHKDKEGTVWTPDDARDWFKLGYTYPELQRWTYGKDPITNLLRDMTEMYNVTRKEALKMGEPGSRLSKEVKIEGENVSLNDYALSIKFSNMGGSPFNVEVYLRPEDEEEEKFRTEDFITNVYNFSQPAEQNGQKVCSNCSDLEGKDVPVAAYIPLTSYLIKKIQQQQLRNLEPATVEEFLSRVYYRVAQNGKTVPKEKWESSLKLDVTFSKTEMTYSKNPSTPSKFDNPEGIPSLGISGWDKGEPATPASNVLGKYVSVNSITQLEEVVSVGGSIIVQSPNIKLNPPSRREPATGISLLYLDSVTGDESDSESFDVLLNISIRSGRQVLECGSKKAHHGFGKLTELKPRPWFQKDDPKIRIDISETEFLIYVDGRKIGGVNRAIREGNVTHVRYWTFPPHAKPVMGGDITITTHQTATLVS